MLNEPVFIVLSALGIGCSLVYLASYLLLKKPDRPAGCRLPGVSLIVPMWNEEKTIIGTLESVLAMKENYGGELEIIVIDDRSTDDSYDVVRQFTDSHPEVRLYRKEGRQGKSESLNQGIVLARHGLVGCVDADSYPLPDALSHIVREFEDPMVGAATSMLVVNRPRHAVEWFQHVEYVFSNFILRAFDSVNSVIVTRRPLSLFRKDVMEKIHGFLPSGQTPTDDMEITLRIRKAGYAIRCSRGSKVLTTVMPTWKNLFWQRMRWNRGTLINFWLHRDMFFRKRFGFFGMFALPVSLSLIVLTVGVFTYTMGKVFLSLVGSLPSLYSELLASPMEEMVAATTGRLESAPVATLSVLGAMWGIFLLGNLIGLADSRERINGKYLAAMLATPFVYGPVLVFFWACAFAMQAFRTGVRWR